MNMYYQKGNFSFLGISARFILDFWVSHHWTICWTISADVLKFIYLRTSEAAHDLYSCVYLEFWAIDWHKRVLFFWQIFTAVWIVTNWVIFNSGILIDKASIYGMKGQLWGLSVI